MHISISVYLYQYIREKQILPFQAVSLYSTLKSYWLHIGFCAPSSATYDVRKLDNVDAVGRRRPGAGFSKSFTFYMFNSRFSYFSSLHLGHTCLCPVLPPHYRSNRLSHLHLSLRYLFCTTRRTMQTTPFPPQCHHQSLSAHAKPTPCFRSRVSAFPTHWHLLAWLYFGQLLQRFETSPVTCI